jgi:hypothetical protein
MNENDAETPEQVVKFAPKSGPRTDGFEVEEIGQAIVAKLQKATELSNENCRTIHKQIEEKLITPRLASGAEQRSLP